MSIRGAYNTIKHPGSFFRSGLSHEKLKENVEIGLCNLYHAVKNIPKATLDGNDIEKLSIKVEELHTSAPAGPGPGPVFFEPMSISQLQEHPVASDEETQNDLSMFNGMLQTAAAKPTLEKSPIDTATNLSYRLHWEMSGSARDSMPRFGMSLTGITDWLFQEGFTKSMFRPGLWGTLFLEENPPFAPTAVWYDKDQEKKPHLIISTKHGINGNDNILRGELLIIIGAMRSRFSFEAFKKHLIIPVQIISFMGPQHGRIIQSFYDGENLIVRKSQLIELTDPATYPFDVFVRFAASKAVGDTRHLPKATKDFIPIYNDPDVEGTSEKTQSAQITGSENPSRRRSVRALLGLPYRSRTRNGNVPLHGAEGQV